MDTGLARVDAGVDPGVAGVDPGLESPSRVSTLGYPDVALRGEETGESRAQGLDHCPLSLSQATEEASPSERGRQR